MSNQRSVVSGVQFWNNIIASVDQKVMTDIHTVSNRWKETNGNAAIHRVFEKGMETHF